MEVDSLVGFRFQPTSEEIIRLLKVKRLDPGFSVHTVKEIDFYNFDPWELTKYSDIQCKEPIWYFYCKPYYKYSKSKREHRRTPSGYWKINGQGSDMTAKNSKHVIGKKKILSFYLYRPISKKAKPEWIMHEIIIEDDPLYKEDFVVCRLERRRPNKPSISTSDDSESSQQRVVVAEDNSPKSVLPPNQPISNRNHVAEKTLKSWRPPSQCCNGYSDLDNDCLSELQSPTHPEQGWSYVNSPGNDCDLNSHCDGEQVNDLINSQRAFHCGETGQTLNPEFNSSKSDGGVDMEAGSEADAETDNAWADTLIVSGVDTEAGCEARC